MVKERFKELTGFEGNEFIELHSGLSNVTYAVDGEYALRIKKPSDKAFYSSKYEEKVLMNAVSSGIAPDVIAFDKNGDCVTRWIKDSRAYVEPSMSDEDLINTVELIKKVHKLPRIFKFFSAIQRYSHYKMLSKVAIADEYEDKVVALAKTIFKKDKAVLSHNDMVFGNLIKDVKSKRIYLIDYEFSGMNHPFFDLASLISENLLESKEQFNLILRTYLDRDPTEEEKVKLLLMIAFENYLWYYWALARFNETGNTEFETIARIKKDEIVKTSSYMFKKMII